MKEQEPVNLQAKVQPSTHLWLKMAAVEQQLTLGELLDKLVKDAKRAKPRE